MSKSKCLNTEEMEAHTPQVGSYGFTAPPINELGSMEYTLCSICADVSISVAEFKSEMEMCLQSVINTLKQSPRADNLLVRLQEFGDNVNEIHGFKPLESCNLDDYKDVLTINGCTALYDAAQNAIASTGDYGKKLRDEDFSVNGIAFIITDGCDNSSAFNVNSVRESIKNIYKKESLESFITILIGVDVDDPNVSDYLQDFKKDAGIDHYIEIKKADANSLAKLADFLSKSISSQSQSLGTGGPSTNIPDSLSI